MPNRDLPNLDLALLYPDKVKKASDLLYVAKNLQNYLECS